MDRTPTSDREPGGITLVPHTHWDREWYEPFSVFSERLVAMMDTLIEIGHARFPHFHLDGQTAMVDDYLALRPEREADIRELAALGRMSLGPWVAQMDEFLTSGESQVRNLEMGLARARELGPPLEVGYMPDQFGHIGQMPQILRMHGVEHAVVWRGVPAAVDRTCFWWESPDGSRVLTEYMTFGYANGEAYEHIRDPRELAAAIERSVEELRPFLGSDRMLVMVGTDHAGPDTTLPERLASALAFAPTVRARIAGLTAYLDGQVVDPDLPTWRGELRSSARAHLLPNVYSARVHQKRERGRVEALIERYAEPLAALVPDVGWPQEHLDRAWTLLLWNGAHDSACGCSHDQVARDVEARFAEAREIGSRIADAALEALGSQMSRSGVIRFNPSPFDRDGVPGLGWEVLPAGHEPATEDLDVVQRDGWIVVGGIAFTLRDEPDVGDLYNYCFATEGQVASAPDRLEVDGRTVVATWEGLQVHLRALRFQGDPFVRLEGVIENMRPDHRLRLHVRLPTSVSGSVAGSPFELVDRPLIGEGSSLEAASATWPARGVVLAGAVAVYDEGVFEYEVVGGSELAITMLRCVGTISREVLATRPFDAGPDVPTPEAQMLGTTPFALGLRPDASREALLSDWERFALPLLSGAARGGGHLPATGHLLDLSGDAVLSSIRRRDGRLEVRVWNPDADRPAIAAIAGRSVRLRPAEIATVDLG